MMTGTKGGKHVAPKIADDTAARLETTKAEAWSNARQHPETRWHPDEWRIDPYGCMMRRSEFGGAGGPGEWGWKVVDQNDIWPQRARGVPIAVSTRMITEKNLKPISTEASQ